MNHEEGVPNRVYNLRSADIHSFQIIPSQQTQLRNRTVHHFNQGTDTTHETRDFAQTRVPTGVRAQWRSNDGHTGSYEAPNPPPQGQASRTRSWATWGAGVGMALGAYVGAQAGRSIGSATHGWGQQLGETAGQYLGAGIGAIAGAGLGALAGYFGASRSRYDAGHMLPRQMGGAGHSNENIFGQNPQINRGNHLNGQPTFQQFRAGENEMTRRMKHGGGGQFTFKLLK